MGVAVWAEFDERLQFNGVHNGGVPCPRRLAAVV